MIDQDKADITEVLNLYAFALDAHAWDLFERVFTQDVVVDLGPAGANWSDLANFTRSFAEFHKTLDNHQHTMMGHLIDVKGDTAHAFTYGNWRLVRVAAEGGPSWLGRGWYDDVLVRIPQGWRIKRRTCRLLSWTGNPAVPEPNQEHHPDMRGNALRAACDAGQIGYLQAVRGHTSRT